ncbi:hypothetical protein M2G91_22000, partial [Vibrio vulnificus]|nr:hypothetical protein [Vibrio vulnificus]
MIFVVKMVCGKLVYAAL